MEDSPWKGIKEHKELIKDKHLKTLLEDPVRN